MRPAPGALCRGVYLTSPGLSKGVSILRHAVSHHVTDPTVRPSISDRELVGRLLVCPRCRSGLTIIDADVRCTAPACGFTGVLTNGVVAFGDRSQLSFFDDRHEVMSTVNRSPGVQRLCYERQSDLVERLLQPGMLVLDIGCGPSLPYRKPADTTVIGLEASFESIRVNQQVDLRLYGTAGAIPLPDRSVDLVLAYYAVHHMTGRTTAQNRQVIAQVFRELGRVVKPGGEILVFEVSPWPLAWLAEQLLWNAARSVLGQKLDMFFYSAGAYERIGRATLPAARFTVQPFETSLLSTFPPVFSLPWLRVPRFLFPFDVNLYRWSC